MDTCSVCGHKFTDGERFYISDGKRQHLLCENCVREEIEMMPVGDFCKKLDITVADFFNDFGYEIDMTAEALGYFTDVCDDEKWGF